MQEQISRLQDKVRKLQKETFVKGEKLNLAEKMNKLKDRDAMNLRKKIEALDKMHEELGAECKTLVQAKDKEKELSMNKVGRELKTLYEQNKELIEHNR